MRKILAVAALGAAVLLGGAALVGQNSGAAPASPAFTADGKLVLPADYREWIFLSSGLAMTYGPLRANAAEQPNFENVFVTLAAYRSFLETGTWPEHTMFVLEVRHSGNKASINTDGHFQTDIRGIEAEVKDSSRFATKWAFFGFEGGAKSGAMLPATATCYSCHGANGAVDNTFVQFYPTLIGVARAHGTFHESHEPPSGENK